MIHTRIVGTGSYTPSNIVTNHDLNKYIDVDDKWIQSRTGIKERRIITDQGTVDLAFEASIKALADAQIDKSDIDLVIVATVTPDNHFPSNANLIQAKLGLNEVMAFDVNSACSGFIYALNIADKMIRSGAYNHALVVGVDAISKLTDWRDRSTCVLFGDGAGAMVISKSEDNNIRDIICGSKGDVHGLLTCRNISPKKLEINALSVQDHVHMQGADVFKFASTIVPKLVRDLLLRNSLSLDDLDCIVAHQANKRIIQKAAKDLNFSMDKMFLNIHKYGNTSAASVPLAIDEAIQVDHLKKGDTFIAVAFGGGLSWGAALITL
jgi:3-oxoacyl-[acyl-carrier-protein] synthase-3